MQYCFEHLKRDGKDRPEHYNTEAALFAQSLREMRSLLKLFGGEEDSLYVGAGDLYVTVFGGRTRRLGTLLGEGYTADEALGMLSGVTLESVVITKRMYSVLKARGADDDEYPLMFHICSLLDGGTDPIPWDKFTK
jgi:glycerol-3-phosphate dehydrogenase (NAD(P)+)